MASVRQQLIVSFVLFALVLGGLFSAVTLFVFLRVEDLMIERRLEQMLVQEPGVTPSSSVFFVGIPGESPAPYPGRLEPLGAGFHEWEDDGRETHALLVHDGPNSRVALASFPETETSENQLAIALLIGIAVTSITALLLARYLATRIVSPIEQLTERLASGPIDTAVPDTLADTGREDEIGTLARAMKKAGQDLSASAERERRFLREASHELRTPLTIIQGVSDLLEESIATDDALTRRRLERLDRSLRRMNTSVLSLLAMARAEHRSTVTEMPSFSQQLADVVEETRALAQADVHVVCHFSTQPKPLFEASMLIVALSNLTRNSAQHTQTGTIQIEISTEQACVQDDGPGLSSEQLNQFNTSGPQPDIGIGLATVRRICKRFGWRFKIDCPNHGGTVATIQWKKDDVATAQTASPPSSR